MPKPDEKLGSAAVGADWPKPKEGAEETVVPKPKAGADVVVVPKLKADGCAEAPNDSG